MMSIKCSGANFCLQHTLHMMNWVFFMYALTNESSTIVHYVLFRLHIIILNATDNLCISLLAKVFFHSRGFIVHICLFLQKKLINNLRLQNIILT